MVLAYTDDMHATSKWIDRNVPALMNVVGGNVARCHPTPFANTRKLIRKHASALQEIVLHAETADPKPLREIQKQIEKLVPIVSAPLRIAVVVAVGSASNGAQMEPVKTWMKTFEDYDFHVYCYTCLKHTDLSEHRRIFKGQKNLVSLKGKIKSGCKLAFWVDALEAMKHSSKQYTHVWFIDNDLDLRHFRKQAFEALVRHNAPLVCQPGILRRSRSERGSDHPLCEAQFAPDASRAHNFGSFGYDFRGRRLRDTRYITHSSVATTLTGIEVMCPLLDARILDAFLTIVRNFDDRSDWACERVFNQLATEFAAAAAALNVPRVSKLVLDFVPLIHVDTRTIGKTSDCQRKDLDSVAIGSVCKYLASTQKDCHPLAWSTIA